MSLENSGSFLVRVGKNVPGNMAGLIDAMVAYQGIGGPRVNELYIVFKEAQHWRKKYVSKVWATNQNQREENGVQWLMGEVINELNQAEPGLGTAFQNYETKSTGGEVNGAKTKLGNGYRFERKTYVEDKTKMPFSGSEIHKIAGVNNVNFENLTRRQWDDMAIGQWSTKQKAVSQMYFLNKIQRLKLLATCVPKAGGVTLWEDIQGRQLQSKYQGSEMASLNSRQMYAMDRFGNLFVDYEDWGHGAMVLGINKNPKNAAVAARGKSNHSSLCAGREVICAGMIFFWKGQLIHFDNSSGHYAPRPAALHTAIGILRDAGANLNYLRVATPKDAGGMNYYKAQTFLANGRPDWPDQSDDSKQDAIYAALPGFQP